MIPLVLMAGFLGAGKTRFLTQLIPALAERGVRTRIILNDFENATVDAARLGALDALVTPLNGECVCCGSLRELLQTLYDVPPDAGSVMLIEANGATETDELLGHLTTDPRLAQYTLPLQLTVIDAGRWQKRWWHNGLEQAQARTATQLYLNWTEQLSAARREAVASSLRTINSHATLVSVASYAEQLSVLVGDVEANPDAGGRSAAAASSPAHEAHAHGHRAHAHPFGSLALPLPATVDRATFQAFVAALPSEVVRAKGLVRFADTPREMFVWNRVPGRKVLRLDRSWPHDDANPTALFIGVAMSPSDLSERIATLAAMFSP
jgi:G3E family GTPase